MNPPDAYPERLARLARQAPQRSDVEPPPGFTTRVVAGLRPPEDWSGFGRLQWASVIGALAMCASCVAWEWAAPRTDGIEVFTAQLNSSLLDR